MGYSTRFEGIIELDKPLDKETYTFLKKFSNTRRMKRNLGPEYGVEGEYYVDGKGDYGQDREDNVVDYNAPPSTQPGLWCHWTPTKDKKGIKWDDGGEKFYEAAPWMDYILNKILAPKGYIANGTIEAQGEELADHWWLHVENNKISTETTEDLEHNLNVAEERNLILTHALSNDLPLLVNHTWASDENEKMFKNLIKNQPVKE